MDVFRDMSRVMKGIGFAFAASLFALTLFSAAYAQPGGMTVSYYLADVITDTYERVAYTTYRESPVVSAERTGPCSLRLALEDGAVLDVFDWYGYPGGVPERGVVWGYDSYVCETVTDTTYVLVEVKEAFVRGERVWEKENLMYVDPSTFRKVLDSGMFKGVLR